jgi:hypothetical protein
VINPTLFDNRRATVRAGILLLIVMFVAGGLAGPAFAWLDEPQFRRDLEALTAHPTRVIGSPGYDAATQYLEEQLSALPGVEWRRHEYTVMVPVTQSATMTLPAGGVVDIYPFWPAHIRHNSTPPEGITGRLVYVRNADFDDLQPASLAGQIAVLETSAEDKWRQAVYFGARALIVLGTDKTTNLDLRHHELTVPVNIPRFYLPPGELADQLRNGQIAQAVTLQAQVTWERRVARNYYALVQSPLLAAVNRLPQSARWALGRSMNIAPADYQPTTAPAALMFSVPFESSGLVPDLAKGASQAVQTAAGLALLRDLSRQPLNRPVVVFFSGGDSIQFLGMRNMFMALSDVPAHWRRELAELGVSQARTAEHLRRIRQIGPNPRDLNPTADRELIDRIVKIIETDAMFVQEELFRLRTVSAADRTQEMIDREQQLQDRQAFLSRVRFAFQQRTQNLTDELLEDGREYVRRTEERLARLIGDYQARQTELETRIELYRWLADRLYRDPDPSPRTNNSRLIELQVALDLSDQGVRVGPMYWGWFQRSGNISQLQSYRDWFRRVEDRFRENPQSHPWYGQVMAWLDLEPLSGVRAPQSWLCASMPIGSEMAPAWGVPGFSMITLDDLRLRRDTPADTLESIDLDSILTQLHAVRTLFWNAWNDPRFRGPVEQRWQRNSWIGQVVSPAAGRPVPDLPREGFLATYYYVHNTRKIPNLFVQPYTMGIRRNEVRDSDAEGYYRFEGLPRLGHQLFAQQVYRIDRPSGAITASSDLGKQAGDVRLFVDIRQQEISPVRSLVFNCTEFSLVGLYDPRFLQDLGELLPLDARRNAEPQRFNFMLAGQLLAGYVEPGMRSYLVFRYGRVGNRLILVNMIDPDEALRLELREERGLARGFDVPQLDAIEPLALVTARDFWRLNSIRLSDYRRAGVSSPLIDDLQQQSSEQLSAARQAYLADSGAEVVRDANGAWANQARVYSAAEDMARDVIRAAIFLLLLCVPFAFCMERLLIGTPNIYRQIGFMFLFFGIMTAALWSFHPAFKISASPLIIILAFAIIFMSVVVISVVYSKFDTELKRIRSGRGSAESASFARASVLMSAVLLGIANMRKRKFRTALTSVTIILITFAVLAFTSTTRYLDTTTLPTGVATEYEGLMLRQRGFRPMPAVVTANLQVVLGDQQNLVERWWNINASDPKDQVHVIAVQRGQRGAAINEQRGSAAPGEMAERTAPERPRLFASQAVLGLSPGESQLSRIADVIGPRDFARLENGERDIIYFSRSIAERLAVQRGDFVKLGGMDLEVAGLFDANAFDQQVTMLSGEPIAPLQYAAGALDAGGRRLDAAGAEDLDLDPEATAGELAGAYEHLPATQFVIVPAEISRMLPNARLRSIGLRLEPGDEIRRMGEVAMDLSGVLRERHDAEAMVELRGMLSALEGRTDAKRVHRELAAVVQRLEENPEQRVRAADDLHGVGLRLREFDPVKEVSDELAKRFAIAIFAGYPDGVRMVAASNLASVSGAGQVAIPMAIAGLIIFNTMMGSIAERRREIHVYTSLGLAPMHVGALFVAEAMTYGLIGAVFGYVIGQGAGTALLQLGWLGGATLNYSGTSAILTMGLILVVVLLSALVPARLASKIAAPSIERTWKVPLPKGDEIIAALPFTINKTAADGALAYLAEYFDAHQEGSIGRFSAGNVEAFSFEDDQGRLSRGLKTVIWLTPFDLGVRQHLMLLIHPGQFQDIYEVQVVLQRLSGDDGSWYRMNRTFLTELRKQFLQWRSLSPQRMLEYVEESHRLFQEREQRGGRPAAAVSTPGTLV